MFKLKIKHDKLHLTQYNLIKQIKYNYIKMEMNKYEKENFSYCNK